VLSLHAAEVERDVHGRVVFRGPRVKMGIYSGLPTRVVPHTTTGRADYFGEWVVGGIHRKGGAEGVKGRCWLGLEGGAWETASLN